MNNTKLFWGMLLIAIGLIVLANNVWNIDLGWSALLRLWPLVFIFWGIYLMVKSPGIRSALVVFIAVFLALSIFSTIKSVTGFFSNKINLKVDGPLENHEFVKEFSENVLHSSFKFSAGAGAFKLVDTTANLFHASSESFKDAYEFYSTSGDSSAVISLEMKDKVFYFDDGKVKNKVWMALNTKPVWDIELNTGAAALSIDLSPYRIEMLNVDMGAASLKLKFGNLADETRFDLDAGVSDIEIEIPDDVACEIRIDDALSSKTFSGFRKINDDTYRSMNFDSAAKKIFMNMDVGVSSISVGQYTAATW